MPASFLHGVETIEIEKGARTIRTVKTAVVGLVGTAPIDDVDAEFRTVNEPTLILNEIDAVKYFGSPKNGYTIPQALQAIFDQGAGVVIVVNVFDPSKHESVSDVLKADIIGGVDPITGKRTGMKAFEDCYSLFGYFPKTIIAPV
jgi:phage tail sheath protein FI